MQIFQAVVMGALQGLTEFLPVSSSGHIVISSAIYKLAAGGDFSLVGQEEIFFDILIHLATLFAILIYFFKDIKQLVLGFCGAVYARQWENVQFKHGVYILSATFITCIIGYFIRDFAHLMTQKPFVVSFFLIVTGVVLLFCEKTKYKNNKIDFKTALLIGLAQGFAVLPGISRSGMTIASAVAAGVNKVEAARFSFILSVPIIILASMIYPLLTFDLSEVKNFNYGAIGLGMLTSFVVGYFCIKYFMKFLEKRSLRGFCYYCFIAGAICAILFTLLK